MDSLLHFRPGDTWLLRGRGVRDTTRLLAPAAAPRGSAPPAISRWRGLETIPLHLLQMLREARANDAFARRLEDLQVCVSRAEVQLRQLTAAQPWQVPGAGPVLGGDAMLASWRKVSEGGPLAREFATYACHVSACTRQLQEALASFDQLAQQAVTQDRHGPLYALAESLILWGDTLVEDEVADEVMLRIQAYPELYEEMQDEADGGSDEAAASLESLGDADLLRLDWAGGQRTKLFKAMTRLRGI